MTRRREWLGLALALGLAGALAAPARAQDQKLEAVEVEGQPLAENARRLLEALQFLGAPLPAATADAVQQAARDRDAKKLQQLLDPQVLLVVNINPESLRTAEAGVYDIERFQRFSESYALAGGRASLSNYYTAGYSSAVFDRSLKKAILFSDHSLATDSAFAEVELASCRNVLIYFERELQDRAIGVLYDSLCRKGFLGLGLKETLRFSSHAPAFTDFVREDRIYQRI